MLTVLDALSVAGDRGKQNDDACGAHGNLAWVIDGATDLHDAPFSGAASDAAWIARELDRALRGGAGDLDEAALRALVREASAAAAARVARWSPPPAPWQKPIASALLLADAGGALVGLDLGDCRLYALGADDAAHAAGGPPDAADKEEAFVAQIAQDVPARADGALWRAPNVLAVLREARTAQNTATHDAKVFSTDPACADAARVWRLPLARPGHVLLASDGFSALVDRYNAYDAAGLVQAAATHGVAALAGELRAIERDDAGGARHPRFKRSDDATALLLRVT